MSQKIYDELTAKGVEVIWDDRPVSAGVMFSDADLFGVPVRVIVSPKGLKNGTIEVSARDKSMQEKKPVDEAVAFVVDYVTEELAKLGCRLYSSAYKNSELKPFEPRVFSYTMLLRPAMHWSRPHRPHHRETLQFLQIQRPSQG